MFFIAFFVAPKLRSYHFYYIDINCYCCTDTYFVPFDGCNDCMVKNQKKSSYFHLHVLHESIDAVDV